MTDETAARPAGPGHVAWLGSALGAALVLSLPAWGVRFPIATDLPQHLSQVRQFLDILAGRDPALGIRWMTPYLLGEWPALLATLVAPARYAGHGTVVLLALVVPALPTRYTNTVQFETRWAAPALALLLPGARGPRLKPALAFACALSLLVVAASSVRVAWQRANEEELNGLAAALDGIGPRQRVLGLNFHRDSAFLAGTPHLQAFAWAQVERGAELHFSFADFANMPVTYREPRVGRWTVGLEWFPEQVKQRDIVQFDHVLVHASPEMHARFRTNPRLEAPAIADDVRGWRRYAVRTASLLIAPP